MADVNINAVPATNVRKSFVVSVNVDESASYEDLKFVDLNQDRANALDTFLHGDHSVFFAGQEDLAARWMSMGNGALPLNLFLKDGVKVTPAPVTDISAALNILETLLNDGVIDQSTADALNRMESLLIKAENALSTGH